MPNPRRSPGSRCDLPWPRCVGVTTPPRKKINAREIQRKARGGVLGSKVFCRCDFYQSDLIKKTAAGRCVTGALDLFKSEPMSEALSSKKQVSDFLVIQRSSDVRAVDEKQMNISVRYQLLPSQYIPRHRRHALLPAALSDYVLSYFTRCDKTMPMEEKNSNVAPVPSSLSVTHVLGSDLAPLMKTTL